MLFTPTMRLQQRPLMRASASRSNGRAAAPRSAALAARESATAASPIRSRRRCLSSVVVVVAAAASNPEDSSEESASKGFPSLPSFRSIPNPFSSRKKEDDAKNLLKGMFEGKGDPLSLYDNGGPGYKGKQGGGGEGGGGGGGGSGGSGSGDSRSNNPLDLLKAFLQKFLSSVGSRARGVLKVLLAILAFGSLFVAVPLAKPTAAAGVKIVNWVMRLDSANPRSRLEKQALRRKEAILRAEAEAAAAEVAERGGEASSSTTATRNEKGAPKSSLLLGKNEVRALAKYGPEDLSGVVEAAAEAGRRAAAELAVAGKKGR